MSKQQNLVAAEPVGPTISVTWQELEHGLRELGLVPGDLVLVSSSLAAPDWVEGGAEVAVQALLAAVGPQGTVAMHTGEEVTGWPRPLFSPRTSPSEMGPVSDAFWRRPGARRSGSPTGSVAAIGPLADELTRTHAGDEQRDSPWGDHAFGCESPWQQLYDRDAKYLLFDGDYENATLFRLAQVMYMESRRGQLKPDVPCPCFNQTLMGQKLEEVGLVKQVRIGQVTAKLISARQFVDRTLALLHQEPLAFFPEGFHDRFGFAAWHRQIPYMEKRLQAGLGKMCITPDVPYGHRGVYRDVWARALVMKDETTAIGLVVADQDVIERILVLEVRRRVEERCGLPASNLMIACTHTHRVPDVYGPPRSSPYAEAVVEAIAQAVCQAAANVRPVRVGVNKVKTEGLVINRRMKMVDGRVFSSRYSVPSTWYIPPEIIQGCGPVDPWLTTLRIEDLHGNVVGVVGTFTGHPLAAFRSRYISGDSFGHAEDLLEAVHPGSIAMLSNGAEGDTIVRGPFPERGPRYDPQAELVGQMIGGYWLAALAGASAIDGGSVSAAQREVELPLRRSFLEQAIENPYLEVGEDMKAELLERGTVRTEVQVLRINDAVLVGLPSEIFVEAQLMIKEKSPFPNTLVIGTANDFLGYIPTRAAFAEGGYEVAEIGEWGVVTEDALGILGMAALELIDELWKPYALEETNRVGLER